ncbi:hypothetical protein Bca4012_058770 [Brassica carinata]
MFNKKNVAHGNKETGVLERQEIVDVSFPKGKRDMDDRLERVETSTTKLENIVFNVVNIKMMQEDLMLCKTTVAKGGTSKSGL